MAQITGILGKGGIGKTFVAAHLGAALASQGFKTLLVGCDQKKDLSHGLRGRVQPSLLESLEARNYTFDDAVFGEVVLSVNEALDVLELGAPQLLVGSLDNILDVGFTMLQSSPVVEVYHHIVMDVSEERFDAASAPLFSQIEQVIPVTNDSLEALFVLNRLLRAVLIGGYELNNPARILGVVLNGCHNPVLPGAYLDLAGCLGLITCPPHPELAALRTMHTHLFSQTSLSAEMRKVRFDFMHLADRVRSGVANLMPLKPLLDEEIWAMEPPLSVRN